MTEASEATSTPKKTTEERRAERLIKDVSHINPETVKALAAAGFHSMGDIFRASAERISEEAKIAMEKAVVLKTEAEKLAHHIAEGARTPEGRQQLMVEGKDFATKTAKNVEAQTRDLLQKARQEGEAAIAKAKELREKAPSMLHEARGKAEAALKDAEAKAKEIQAKGADATKEAQAKATEALKSAQAKVEELAKKTEEVARSEFQKVKAEGEDAIKKVRDKFQKDETA